MIVDAILRARVRRNVSIERRDGRMKILPLNSAVIAPRSTPSLPTPKDNDLLELTTGKYSQCDFQATGQILRTMNRQASFKMQTGSTSGYEV
jgi:hypothetical protein